MTYIQLKTRLKLRPNITSSALTNCTLDDLLVYLDACVCYVYINSINQNLTCTKIKYWIMSLIFFGILFFIQIFYTLITHHSKRVWFLRILLIFRDVHIVKTPSPQTHILYTHFMTLFRLCRLFLFHLIGICFSCYQILGIGRLICTHTWWTFFISFLLNGFDVILSFSSCFIYFFFISFFLLHFALVYHGKFKIIFIV